jgi:hypothetical protein
MPMSRVRISLLSAVIAALVAVVVLAIEREVWQRSASEPAVGETDRLQKQALSADEEAYAAALWPIHSDTVEASAVAMSFAGVNYVTEHHDARRLEATVVPLRDLFRMAADKAQAVSVPPSMQKVHDQYIEALTLYQNASAEMVKVAKDGKVEHLIVAQSMSQRAAEDLLKVGDVLWPSEHKPN